MRFLTWVEGIRLLCRSVRGPHLCQQQQWSNMPMPFVIQKCRSSKLDGRPVFKMLSVELKKEKKRLETVRFKHTFAGETPTGGPGWSPAPSGSSEMYQLSTAGEDLKRSIC
jgi:hypothetical protein